MEVNTTVFLYAILCSVALNGANISVGGGHLALVLLEDKIIFDKSSIFSFGIQFIKE